MKYLLCTADNTVAFLEGEPPRPGAGEIVARLTACGVCGTDALKIYNPGYAKPQRLGHECVGVVAEVGEGVTEFRSGQRIAFAHHAPDPDSYYARHGSETVDPQFKRTNIEPGGFSEFVRLSALHVQHTVVPIPDHVPDLRAVFMEPLACCLRALDRAPLMAGDTCLIVGVGAIGILFLPLLRDAGARALVCDVRPERLELARQWGALAGALASDDVPALCHAHTEGRGADLVILTALNQATFEMALRAVRDGGSLMLFGGKPGMQLALDFWPAFLREINILTSYSATPSGLRRAMQFIAEHDYPFERLISHTFSLAEAHRAFELVHHGRASKVVITPS
ncbi:MAG: alcohol dehydrogenase catalytic domain-containing protein [Anaerolineae bacterium]|nr:alcohol dehydrogenase catalytic domain-containing protein [Candidatus Roseilinea sp.]MDW8450051.1 alcohol dehydrogenase catalytic domain-containing protein [Anaerolineae bacterium]